MEAWLPTIVAVSALGIVFFYIRSSRTELRKDFADFQLDTEKEFGQIYKKREKNEEAYLQRSEHNLLCDNATLKTNDHLTREMQALKDAIFEALRKIERQIKENGNSHPTP